MLKYLHTGSFCLTLWKKLTAISAFLCAYRFQLGGVWETQTDRWIDNKQKDGRVKPVMQPIRTAEKNKDKKPVKLIISTDTACYRFYEIAHPSCSVSMTSWTGLWPRDPAVCDDDVTSSNGEVSVFPISEYRSTSLLTRLGTLGTGISEQQSSNKNKRNSIKYRQIKYNRNSTIKLKYH